MASESASPDDYMDMNATGLPPRPWADVSAQDEGTGGSTNVVDSTVAPLLLVQSAPQHGGMQTSSIRALNDDDPPIPVLQIVDHEKETEGPQLHDGPPGPSCFPSEFDDSLAKRVECESERNLSDHAPDSASTVHSTARASMANTAAVGPSMVARVEEGSVSSRGRAPPMSSHTEATLATSAGGLNPPPAGRSTFNAEAYRVEEADETPGRGTVYEAELIEPQVPIVVPMRNAVLPFYQRKGFVSVMIAGP